MSRKMIVGAAQMGPIARAESRASAVGRMLTMMREAKGRGCDLVVFPELALTTFFPRWYTEDQAEIDANFERDMPNADTRPLFDEAARLGIGFYLGYAELVSEPGNERQAMKEVAETVQEFNLTNGRLEKLMTAVAEATNLSEVQ